MFDIDLMKLTTDFQNPTNFYRAEVIEVMDPSRYTRIQIKIFGLTDDIPDSFQPWCEMQFPTRFIAYPNEKDLIWIFLENGDIFRPIYLGTTFAPFEKKQEAHNIQTKVPDEYFEGWVTTPPHLKLSEGREWWRETTIKSFMRNDAAGSPATIMDKWTTLEFDDHPGAERLQLMFKASEGFITFSMKEHRGLEIYTNGTINIESRNQDGLDYNKTYYHDCGWRMMSDKNNWITSGEDTYIQAGLIPVIGTPGVVYNSVPEQQELHLQATGSINIQSAFGDGILIRASANDGVVEIGGNGGITLGKEIVSEDLFVNNGGLEEYFHSQPILLGDNQKGTYFLTIDAEDYKDAAYKLGSLHQFFTMCKILLDTSDIDSIAKNFAGQVAGGLGIPFASSVLASWEDGYKYSQELKPMHLIESWENIQIRAKRDSTVSAPGGV